MDTKCAVCNVGDGHVVCDGCGRLVCFNCFRFLNSRKLCASCVSDWEKKRRWQTYAQQYTNMTPDEKAGLWAILSPEERLMLEGQMESAEDVRPRHATGPVRKYGWLAFAIVGCLLVLFYFFGDSQVWKKAASVASQKLGSEVGSLAGSVRREVVDLTAASDLPAASIPSQPAGPIELVSQHLRKSGLPVTAGNLRMKTNPAGDGVIVYSPHYFGPNRRLAWIVIGGQAYSLTQTSQEVTPSLRSSRTIAPPVWKKTGLSREKALSQLESLWE